MWEYISWKQSDQIWADAASRKLQHNGKLDTKFPVNSVANEMSA